ncbi:MAG: hypothetical protein AB7E73_04085 [Burkholderiales bacterium]
MVRLLLITVIVLLSGCAVTLHGQQTTGGGSTTTTTGSSVQGGTRIGNARLGGSFGNPPAPSAAGGQLALSKGASAVMLLGVVIAGTVDAVRDWLQPQTPQLHERPAPDGIAHTCSCYGWQPGLTSGPVPQ